MKSRDRYVPKDFDPAADWLICNGLVGAISYVESGSPIQFDESLMPSWYSQLTGDRLEKAWDLQDEYVRRLLRWIGDKGIVDAYFDGAYEKSEKWFLDKYQIKSSGKFDWQSEMVTDLPEVNTNNLLLEAADGTMFIEYGNWQTTFIKDTTRTFPDELKAASIVEADL
ncbi:MAG TPA: hypothetical protein VLH86_05125 [Patescibacteria group bacterium]|nr:hypothetical protein [Patescibacteria group bacterium]